MVRNSVCYSDSIPALIAQLLPQIADLSQLFVLTEENVKGLCYERIRSFLPAHQLIVLKPGERHKNLDSCSEIWHQLSASCADRKALVLNLGGGMITDVGGFSASCYKRGISFLNVPTTLLAMVDAAIGGKTGIDFHQIKNQIGTFNQPDGIFCCAAFLETLPVRQYRSGMAEVMKHFLISSAEKWQSFTKLPSNNFSDLDSQFLRDAAQVKLHVVTEDPLEKGKRKTLNFGHTIGHAIESAFMEQNEELLHGEAVALGLVAESFLSFEKNWITNDELQTISHTIFRWFQFQKSLEEFETRILAFLQQDKKNDGHELRFALLQPIGNCLWDVSVTPESVKSALRFLNQKIREHAAVPSHR
ncbi:MAG: 3-dehydroquinate synthase [Chitinophagales bacterium]